MTEPLSQIALKIDVSSYLGTRVGVPRLIEILKRLEADASFFFTFGPDYSGRSIKKLLHASFLKHFFRTSPLRALNLRTLLSGTLLPAPQISRRCAEQMRMTRDHGFEVGINSWDYYFWRECIAEASNKRTESEMLKAIAAFEKVFGCAPKVHAAAAWQMNRHALRLTQRYGFDYASDGRGTRPFLPLWDAEPVACIQLPTTLPTLDELIGLNGITLQNIIGHLLLYTAEPPDNGHVYTLRAEIEGMKMAEAFEKLLWGWKDQGYQLVSLRTMSNSINKANLPRCDVYMGNFQGCSNTLLVQGNAFA